MNDLYHDAIMAAARRTSGHGRLARPHGSATVDNPLCGDRVTIDVELGPPGKVARVGHVVRGCVLCEAAAVLIAEQAPERGLEELLCAGVGVDAALRDGASFPWPELEMFAPVRSVGSRHRCVGLSFEALAAALGESAPERSGPCPGPRPDSRPDPQLGPR